MLSECAGVRRRGRVLETWVASALAPRPPPAPRHGKADLLSYHCSSVAPASNAQPPPGTAAHAADTMCGGGQPRACEAAPGMGGCSHPPPPVCREAQDPPHPLAPPCLDGRKSPSIQQGAAGRGDSVSPVGTAAGTGCPGPRDAAMGKCWCEGDCSPWASGARGWFPSLPGQSDPLHFTHSPPAPQPSARPRAGWGAGSPFCSFAMVLIGRKSCGPVKTRPSAADGYLECAAPIPVRHRARRFGRFGCIFLDCWPSAVSCKAACFSFSVGLTSN